MKRKIGLVCLTVLSALFFACGLTACKKDAAEEADARIYAVYEVYVAYAEENGTTPLSYEEWYASIQGKDGKDGVNGKDGIDGKDGKDGETPYIKDGTWWIGETDTGVKATGENGNDGKDGEDGETPYIKDGTWWIGDTDTGVKTTGENGNDGKDGENGETPYIKDGTWWIGDTDTGVKTTGENGNNGKDGEDGVSVQSVSINGDGDLIVTLSDGTVMNAGQVVAPEKRLDENNKLLFKTFTAEDKTISGKVSNETEIFYFADEIELKGGAGYTVYRDFDCTQEIVGKAVTLSVGDNTFYLVESCEKDSRFYTVTVRRRPLYTLTFEANGGTPVESVTVEEDGVIEPPLSERAGYGLTWDYDFATPVTQDGTVTASWTPVFKISGNIVTGLTDYGKTLQKIVIPSAIDGNSVTSITSYAFKDCIRLTSVTIENGVTSINYYAFQGCTELTSITIPDSVTSIMGFTFEGCIRLTSIILPNSVSSIAWRMFDGCRGLQEIIIPNSVTCIETSAFRGCSGLTNITIPDGVTSIEDYAFKSCSGMTSITIPNSVTSIGNGAFSDCGASEGMSIYYKGDLTSWLGISGLENLMNYGAKTLYISEKKLQGELIIPSNVTSIGNNAFFYCSGLTSVTIPESVTSIGNSAFSYCSGLTSVTIPDSVTSIGEHAFSDCSSLTSIAIPESVTSIGKGMFYGCSGLTSITIPDSVTSIGNGAFSGCSGLTSITIPNSVTSIGDGAIYGCIGLTSIAYLGTMEEWNSVTKGSFWNGNTGSYTVYCTDGEIKK